MGEHAPEQFLENVVLALLFAVVIVAQSFLWPDAWSWAVQVDLHAP